MKVHLDTVTQSCNYISALGWHGTLQGWLPAITGTNMKIWKELTQEQASLQTFCGKLLGANHQPWPIEQDWTGDIQS